MNIHSPYSQTCKLLVTLHVKRSFSSIIYTYISYLALHIFTFVTILLRELNDGENQNAIFVSL